MSWWLLDLQACLSGSCGDADDDDAYFPNIRLRIQDLAHAMRRMDGWLGRCLGRYGPIGFWIYYWMSNGTAGLASAHPLQMTSWRKCFLDSISTVQHLTLGEVLGQHFNCSTSYYGGRFQWLGLFCKFLQEDGLWLTNIYLRFQFVLITAWLRLDMFINNKCSPTRLIQNSTLFKARNPVTLAWSLCVREGLGNCGFAVSKFYMSLDVHVQSFGVQNRSREGASIFGLTRDHAAWSW